jgi:hypothetical protein
MVRVKERKGESTKQGGVVQAMRLTGFEFKPQDKAFLVIVGEGIQWQ